VIAAVGVQDALVVVDADHGFKDCIDWVCVPGGVEIRAGYGYSNMFS